MKLNSLEDTFNFSQKIGKVISNGDVIFLYGEIGVGKTTFVRGLINSLEIAQGEDTSQILSPTFNIMLDYKVNELKIIHCDLYRLKNAIDINELGIFKTLENHVILIEWPELIEQKPKNLIEMFFTYSKKDLDKRNLEIKGHGKWGNYDFGKI